MKDELYYFHQTNYILAKKIIDNTDWYDGEVVCEPFKGEGAFYDQLPSNVIKKYAEIEDGIDFRDLDYSNVDTIISNPPFRLDDGDKRKNAFFDILMFYAKTPVKRVIFLCNDYCLGTLTPNRLIKLNNEKLFINSLTTCAVKKWRGRYYIITFGRERCALFNYFTENFD